MTHVALLRGINVGGKNKLPMPDLVEMFAAAGCRDAQAYIQSGNIMFCSSSAAVAARVPDLISAEIAKRFSYQISVQLRTVEQMGGVVRNNPFLRAGAPESELHVLFLADLPAPRRVKELDPARWLPDTFSVRGQEVYLRLPNGVGRTKLNNGYFDSKLETTSTGRNWRTVTKLFELMAG